MTFSVRGAVGLNYAVASDEVQAFLQEARDQPPPVLPCAEATLALTGYAVVPSSVPPGGTITLVYGITNPASAPVPVVLGASLRAGSRAAWLSDPVNDTPVTVPAGTTTVTRVFQVPVSAAPGRYDVAWGLFCAGWERRHGLQIAPGALLVTGPAPPAVPAAGAPAEAVRQHYAFINARNYRAAWELFTPRGRPVPAYEDYVQGFRTTVSVQTPAVTTVEQTADRATVAVTIIAVDQEGDRRITKRFEGTWALILVDGQWKLDRASIRQTG